MTTTTLNADLKQAVARSRSYNERVTVAVEGADFADVLAELRSIWSGDLDSVEESFDRDDVALDVWGWSEHTTEGEMDWRLRIVLA